MPGLGPEAAEPQRQGELSVTCRQVDLAGERDIAVFRVSVVPGHLVMLGQVLPSVGESGETYRHFPPGHRAGKSQGGRFAVREQGRHAFIVADPTGIFAAAIRQMRRQQRVQAIVGQRALQGHEANPLQHHIPVGVGENFFLDPVSSLQFCVSEFVDWNAIFNRVVLKLAVALLFGEITGAVGDDQALVAGAGLVHSRVVDFVQDAVAEREPYPAVQVERGPDAALGARSPTRRDSRPAGGKAFRSVLTHCTVLVRQLVPILSSPCGADTLVRRRCG